MNTRKTIYSWKLFDLDCKKIARWAKSKKFKNIYGIPRGGLVVAVQLSHFIDIPIILDYKQISSKTLVVDDISDSGKTLAKLGKLTKLKSNVATLFWADTSTPPNFWCRRKLTWVIFPWETNITSKYDKTDFKNTI